MESVESALATVTFFGHLRPDEIGRIAGRFESVALDTGACRTFGANEDEARLIIVVSGSMDVTLDDPTGELHTRMRPGDGCGAAALLARCPRAMRVRARCPSEIALLSRDGFQEILRDFPAVALPLAADLASDLRDRNDQVRQILELQASGLARDQLEAAIRKRRRALAMRGATVRRITIRALFRRLVAEQGEEPPFWMLLGFLVSLAGARLVVFLILKYRLEQQLFALIAGPDPNPMHIHHFNYGLGLVGIAGLGALFPFGRRSLRGLALVFGIGCGLVFDEFALFWNLNPDYSQGLSLISAAIVGVVLVQITYFRRFWLAVVTRAAQKVQGE